MKSKDSTLSSMCETMSWFISIECGTCDEKSIYIVHNLPTRTKPSVPYHPYLVLPYGVLQVKRVAPSGMASTIHLALLNSTHNSELGTASFVIMRTTAEDVAYDHKLVVFTWVNTAQRRHHRKPTELVIFKLRMEGLRQMRALISMIGL